MRKFANFALFQLGWFVSVGFAAHGQETMGPIIVAFVIGLHFLFVSTDRRLDLLFCAVTLVIGPIIDGCESALGLIVYRGFMDTFFPPIWLALLWPLFATTFNSSMVRLAGRYWLGAAFGAVGGALSYWAGVRWGAISFGRPLVTSLLGLAAFWAVAMPTLLAIFETLRAIRPAARITAKE